MTIHDLTLLHWSRRPLQEVNAVNPAVPGRMDKPNGLWVGPPGEDSWEEFCQSNDFNLERFEFVTQIILAPNPGILWISTLGEFDDFCAEYTTINSAWGSAEIRWKDVGERYRGIVISPYRWERRLNHASRWYYGWDCASGCIWDTLAIDRLVPFSVDHMMRA